MSYIFLSAYRVLIKELFGLLKEAIKTVKYIIKKLVPNYENVTDGKVRAAYGMVGGIVGVVLNVILFAVKFILGSLMQSIGIISDSFNNLSDTGSSLVSMLGIKLSNKKPDREHPFGHAE